MYQQTIAELSRALHQKKISSFELTRYFLDRIQTHDPYFNSFITIAEEASALLSANNADMRIARGESTPLTGIPIAHKDIFCTQGMKTSCASKMLDLFIAPYDATVVSRLRQVGTVLLGKTNMDEFAMGSSTETSFYGPTYNPWGAGEKTRGVTPGGSSGGSAAAVAAGLVPGATGTDTGGSIRQPAAMCGITGLKPTYGRVSRFGMIAYASSLDQGGPMARTAEDTAMLLNAMAGYDSRDSTSINRATPDYTMTLQDDLQGLKVGLPREYFDHQLSPEIAACIDETRRVLERQGAIVSEVSLPHTAYAIPVYYVLAFAECASNLARYDGVRFGYRCEHPRDLRDLYERSRAEGFGAEVKRRILVGTYVLSAGYYDAYYLQAQKIRRLIRDDFIEAFKQVDVILTPTSPHVAWEIGQGHTAPDAASAYLADVYTTAVNLAGLPALSVPAGFSVAGLPIGAQLIGHYFMESRLLNIAHRYQQQTDWHLRRPLEPNRVEPNHAF